jgi:diacylglycerol kinase family enzyme
VRIGLLNNLRAGASERQVGETLDLLRDYPHVYHVETESVRAVPEALASLARQQIDLLIVNGGDGTLQYALTQILTTDDFEKIPMVAPLRSGRTNMNARDFGAHRNPRTGLKGLLDDIHAGKLSERMVDRPLLRVETLRDHHVSYGFFFGAGMIHRAITRTHDLFPPGGQGVLGASLVTAGLIMRAGTNKPDAVLAPDKVHIVLDGEPIDRSEFTVVIASSLQRMFLNLNPFWGKEEGPVRFTAVATGSHRMATAIPGILKGRPRSFVKPENGYTSRNVDTAELRLDAGFTVDGEIVEPRSNEVIRITGDRRVSFVRA